MTMQSKRELYFVMMPPYAILLVFGLMVPIAFGIGAIFSLNIGLLVLITSLIYFLVYEWLHWSYHQPIDSFIGRNPIIHWLRRFHQTHHKLSNIKKYNFNVSFPLADYILKTLIWRR